jgi:hypothetical protein
MPANFSHAFHDVRSDEPRRTESLAFAPGLALARQRHRFGGDGGDVALSFSPSLFRAHALYLAVKWGVSAVRSNRHGVALK